MQQQAALAKVISPDPMPHTCGPLTLADNNSDHDADTDTDTDANADADTDTNPNPNLTPDTGHTISECYESDSHVSASCVLLPFFVTLPMAALNVSMGMPLMAWPWHSWCQLHWPWLLGSVP